MPRVDGSGVEAVARIDDDDAMKWACALLSVLAACNLYFSDDAPSDATGGDDGPASRELVAGAHVTCLRDGATTRCWGANSSNQMLLPSMYNVAMSAAAPVEIGVQGTVFALGGEHACAVEGQDLVCWGNNHYAQLGRVSDYADPNHNFDDASPVVGLPKLPTRIVASARHTCAILPDRSLWCWGANERGQVGDGDPLVVRPHHVLDDVRAVAAGGAHTCAIRGDGHVWCFGDDAHGQLGDGGTTAHATPTEVPQLTATAIVAGTAHTCAMDASGAVVCWGAGEDHQLGDGAGNDRGAPGAAIVSDAVSISARADHTCAVLQNGELRCWGANGAGQLGAGDAAVHATPVIAEVSGKVVAVATGDAHTCALRDSGSVACWGGASDGELGDGQGARRTPAPVAVPDGASALAVGAHHACAAIGAEREVFCWGDNEHGQLGDGSARPRATPVATGLTGVVRLAAGGSHTCAVKSDGSMWCWGRGRDGELGDGAMLDRAVPVESALAGVTAVDVGDAFTCASSAGATYCFGANDARQLVRAGGRSPTPVQVATVPYVQLAAGAAHICGLGADGTVTCWGGNDHGQLGNGGVGPFAGPGGPTGTFTSIAAGHDHTCGIQSGMAACWGAGGRGQLGTYLKQEARSPQPVGVSNADRVGVGNGFTCVHAFDGFGYTECFGTNAFGEAATGQYVRFVPIAMLIASGLGHVTVLDGGDGFGCGLEGTSVVCWGDNSLGQLGAGSFSRSLDPIDVPL